jgi:uncharacterized protein
MRVILDSNVIIAAVAARGLCEAVLELCLERHHIILCEAILDEIEEKLSGKIRVSPSVITELQRVLRAYADILEPDEVHSSACRDPDDLKVLGLVVPGNADVIVTGDKDLLVIRTYRGARIMTPRNFWEVNKQAMDT